MHMQEGNSRLSLLNKHKTLIVDASYVPIAIVSWQKAVSLVTAGKGESLELYPDLSVHSINFSVDLPAVLKVRSISRANRTINFNRWTVFARDNFKCCYCGKKFHPKELTLDHITPLSRGGEKSWENITSACMKCNHKKGCKTPKEANMVMHHRPHEPKWNPWFVFRITRCELIDLWKPWFYFKADRKEEV